MSEKEYILHSIPIPHADDMRFEVLEAIKHALGMDSIMIMGTREIDGVTNV